MKISHDRAAAVALSMLDNGVEGAETLLLYIDQQSQHSDLSDRELTLRAWRRSDEVGVECAAIMRRMAAIEASLRHRG